MAALPPPPHITAQSDDGTASAKIAEGLLSDIQTRILLRQPLEEIPIAADLFGLGEREAEQLGRLVQGRARWCVNDRSAIVQAVRTAREKAFTDTDAAMAA